MKSFHQSSTALIKKLSKLEKMGRYDEAFSEIEDIWTDRSALPQTNDLDPLTAAELILRCGSLIGFLGHYKQLPNAQEKSKNLLTEARNRFLDIYIVEKIAECENHMALAYWRSGELQEAEDWVAEALTHKISGSKSVMLHSVIIQSMISLSAKKYDEVIEKLESLELLFLKYADDSLKGSFYNNLGIAVECTGNIPLALLNLEKGKLFHYKSGNKFQCAVAENNLSMLYKAQNNFPKAHQCSDNAAKIFSKIEDRTREGFSLDTKAQIYLAEARYEEALETVEKALKIIKLSENASFITETYLTKTKTLIYLDDIAGATSSLFEAVQLAKIQTGEKAADLLIQEYETALRQRFEKPPPPPKTAETSIKDKKKDNGREATGKLEFVLPTSIAHYQDIQVVQISTSFLEAAGLKKDSLAIIANIDVKKGDLAAIVDLENDAVSCGFYDEDFGIICLESDNPEPVLFDSKKIKILGKIIGVGKTDTANGNKVIVQPLFE